MFCSDPSSLWVSDKLLPHCFCNLVGALADHF
jgi:hypothetical protein